MSRILAPTYPEIHTEEVALFSHPPRNVAEIKNIMGLG